MSDLRIDLDELRRAAASVRTVVSIFSHVEPVAHEVAGLTGYEGLAHRVHEFADSWDIARARLSERLAFIADALGAVADTLEHVDLELKDAIGAAAMPVARQVGGGDGR